MSNIMTWGAEMEKKILVDVQFSRKNGVYKVKLKALHNGSLVIEKSSLSSDEPQSLFEFASAFIEIHNADKVNLKRGMLEDGFAKYLSEHQQNGSHEDIKVIEGILIDSVSEDGQELLADLQTYKLCVDDTIRHKDYEGLLFQGILYNNARQEILNLEGVTANPFEMQIELPLSEKSDFISAVVSLSESELANGLEYFKMKKFNRLVEVSKTDYKLTVNFS